MGEYLLRDLRKNPLAIAFYYIVVMLVFSFIKNWVADFWFVVIIVVTVVVFLLKTRIHFTIERLLTAEGKSNVRLLIAIHVTASVWLASSLALELRRFFSSANSLRLALCVALYLIYQSFNRTKARLWDRWEG